MAPLKNDGGNKSKSDVNTDEIELAMNAKGNKPDKKGKISMPLVYCILIFMCFAVNIYNLKIFKNTIKNFIFLVIGS
ncbi:hypothetical protein M9Y10_006625 [Tritrichomonas musculus]|uniref:Uncharacterized protein n=1 Tax=Tritrichomonas musculus TaxID=1915356 RepID=A0ABR2JEN3_9EUKA